MPFAYKCSFHVTLTDRSLCFFMLFEIFLTIFFLFIKNSLFGEIIALSEYFKDTKNYGSIRFDSKNQFVLSNGIKFETQNVQLKLIILSFFKMPIKFSEKIKFLDSVRPRFCKLCSQSEVKY